MNTELFNRVLAHIKAHPEEWDQGSYRKPESDCGSACCLAGHAVLLAGTPYERAAINGPIWVWVWPVAERLLQVSYPQANWLFDPDRTLEDFEAVAAHGIDVAMGGESP